MRQVSFDGESFIVRDWFSPAIAVPKSHLVSVRAIPVNHGLSWISLKFCPAPPCGATVRIMTGESWQSEKFLRLADELRAVAERRPLTEPRTIANDKAIEVRGWSSQEIDRIVADFVGLYDLPDLQVSRSESKSGTVLRFPCDVQPQLFVFLVNYLHYPEGFDLKTRSVSARGTCTLTADFQLPDPGLVGRRATFFVPADDTEYDFVLAKIESGETYRIPFTNLRWIQASEGR